MPIIMGLIAGAVALIGTGSPLIGLVAAIFVGLIAAGSSGSSSRPKDGTPTAVKYEMTRRDRS